MRKYLKNLWVYKTKPRKNRFWIRDYSSVKNYFYSYPQKTFEFIYCTYLSYFIRWVISFRFLRPNKMMIFNLINNNNYWWNQTLGDCLYVYSLGFTSLFQTCSSINLQKFVIIPIQSRSVWWKIIERELVNLLITSHRR